jgi:anti-anti-sigma factor
MRWLPGSWLWSKSSEPSLAELIGVARRAHVPAESSSGRRGRLTTSQSFRSDRVARNSLQIVMDQVGDIVILRLSGSLTRFSLHRFNQAVLRALTKETSGIVYDLADVDCVDGRGLAALVNACPRPLRVLMRKGGNAKLRELFVGGERRGQVEWHEDEESAARSFDDGDSSCDSIGGWI